VPKSGRIYLGRKSDFVMCFGDVGMEVLSDLVCRLSAEVGLDKSLAISHDTTIRGMTYAGMVKNLSRDVVAQPHQKRLSGLQ
jgi:hypothetical protein